MALTTTGITARKDKRIRFARSTGAAAIAEAVSPGVPFRLLRVSLHLSAAPTTSENFTVTNDAGDGAVYDTVEYKRDLSVGSLTDLSVIFGEGYEYKSNDEIDITYTNTDTRTYGLTIVYELL